MEFVFLNTVYLDCSLIAQAIGVQGESESHSTRVRLLATPWTTQSMEFSRPEYWGGRPFPSPGDLPNPEIKSRSPALQADSLPPELSGAEYSPLVADVVPAAPIGLFKEEISQQ